MNSYISSYEEERELVMSHLRDLDFEELTSYVLFTLEGKKVTYRNCTMEGIHTRVMITVSKV